MQQQTTSPSSAMRTIRGNGFTSANVLQRQEWQQDAIAAADQARSLRAAGITHDDALFAAACRRICAGLGGTLVRLGTRLQATGAPALQPVR